MKRILAAIGVTASVAVVAVPALAAGPTVRVGDNYFKAKAIRVTPGATVTWTWVGSDSHDVRFGTYGSKLKNHGTYRYYCSLHKNKGMKGTVIVAG